MRRAASALAFVLAGGLAGPSVAWAQKLPDYHAAAGKLNIGKDPERPDAEIFHVAYTLKGADPATRPVTFVFNGGPGGASICLHLAAIGPRIIVTAGDGSFPAAPARLQKNPDSWIRFTDLVFIDPVGTGFSRMLPGPDGQLRDHQPAASVGPAAGGTRPSSGPDLSPLGAPRPRLHDPGPWQGRNWLGA